MDIMKHTLGHKLWTASRTIVFVGLVAGIICPAAKAQERRYTLPEFEAWGRRPMKEIGVQKTTIDSSALKDNIAQSMADVLTYNSSVFVKQAGRATLSTVAFRGTSPSHTQVTWNGMKINNPMLGMTDFSTIPSFFVDNAALLHGTSSVGETGGGLGGLVRLGTAADVPDGLNVQYVQGIGSFSTFDEFARVAYGSGHWTTSTRVVYSSSPNDYKYVNHDKKENIYDDNHNIIGQYHPTERNRSASFKDFHILQEVYYNTLGGDRFGLNAWFIHSNRELPMLTTDYGDDTQFENRQRENTLRMVASWDHSREAWSLALKGGYIHTQMAYDYSRELSPDNWAQMTRSRSRVNTFYGQAEASWRPHKRFYLTGSMALYQHFVRSADKNVIMQEGGSAIVGYDKGRVELSGALSARWQPVDPLGVSLVMRQEMLGTRWAPVVPALFADVLLSRRGNVMLKASVSRNNKFPTLNDLYFLPGGNPDLRNERGWSYDAGASFAVGNRGVWSAGGSATWFDSYIDDWIIWLPTPKGFFSPRNVKKVHAYGIELKANVAWQMSRDWLVDLNGSYSWTPSVNRGEPLTPADQSVGKQLPYVPRHSASVVGRLAWRAWSFQYKWAWYSERFTMSSNDATLTGKLPHYFMSNIALERGLSFRPVDLSLKLAVNNLFNEDYLSVLAHPMPGINFEFFIGITPKFGSKKTVVTPE